MVWSVATKRPYTCQIHIVQKNMTMAWVRLAGTGTWIETSEIWSFSMVLPLLLIVSSSISWTEKERGYIREEEGLGKSTMTQNFGIFNLLHGWQLLATFSISWSVFLCYAVQSVAVDKSLLVYIFLGWKFKCDAHGFALRHSKKSVPTWATC